MPPSNQEPDLSLESVRVFAPRAIASTPGEDTSLETQTLKKEQLRVELEKLHAELDSFTQDVRQRRQFAPKLYLLTCCWLAAVLLILVTQGFSEGRWHVFRLNDAVLLALLGTTTVNVVGLFYVVAKYLFPEKGPFQLPRQEPSPANPLLHAAPLPGREEFIPGSPRVKSRAAGEIES